MNVLICKQEAIDALCELYEYQRAFDPTEAADLVRQGIYLAEKKIEQMPSAEPEIVRCKDCKHKHLDGMIWNCPFGLSGGEDFFCAYGAKDGDSDDE